MFKIFKFNLGIDPVIRLQWLDDYWWTSFVFSIIYLISIFYGHEIMKTRQAFQLRLILTCWNIILASYSIVSSLLMVPDLIGNFYYKGFVFSICSNKSLINDTNLLLCVWVFAWSKLFEMFDTFFIILRKQKLIFLHWYHHFLTLIYGFVITGNHIPAYSRWIIAFNCTIHSLMYSYYALKALKFKVSRTVNIFITSFQIIQMILGTIVCTVSLFRQISGQRCDSSKVLDIFGLFVYISYLILFINFFIGTYLFPSKDRLKRE